MTIEIPVTQARDELADLINRVAYGHERIILTRHSKPVACLVPPEDLAQLEQRGQERVNLTSVGPAPDMRHLPPASDTRPIAAQYQPPSGHETSASGGVSGSGMDRRGNSHA